MRKSPGPRRTISAIPGHVYTTFPLSPTCTSRTGHSNFTNQQTKRSIRIRATTITSTKKKKGRDRQRLATTKQETEESRSRTPRELQNPRLHIRQAGQHLLECGNGARRGIPDLPALLPDLLPITRGAHWFRARDDDLRDRLDALGRRSGTRRRDRNVGLVVRVDDDGGRRADALGLCARNGLAR
jgi:hypothetical protein